MKREIPGTTESNGRTVRLDFYEDTDVGYIEIQAPIGKSPASKVGRIIAVSKKDFMEAVNDFLEQEGQIIMYDPWADHKQKGHRS